MANDGKDRCQDSESTVRRPAAKQLALPLRDRGKAYGALGLVGVNYNPSLLGEKPEYRVIYCLTMSNSATRSGRIRTKPRGRLSRVLPRIIIAAAVGWVLFFAYLIYRETSNDEQRAIADCIEEQNRNAVGASGQEASQIALLCAQGRFKNQ